MGLLTGLSLDTLVALAKAYKQKAPQMPQRREEYTEKATFLELLMQLLRELPVNSREKMIRSMILLLSRAHEEVVLGNGYVPISDFNKQLVLLRQYNQLLYQTAKKEAEIIRGMQAK